MLCLGCEKDTYFPRSECYLPPLSLNRGTYSSTQEYALLHRIRPAYSGDSLLKKANSPLWTSMASTRISSVNGLDTCARKYMCEKRTCRLKSQGLREWHGIKQQVKEW